MVSFKKFALAVTVASVAVIAEQTVFERTNAETGVKTTLIKLDDNKAVGNSYEFCGVCVQLMMVSLNYLVNYILNAGVIGSCSELCTKALTKPLEQDVCEALCDATGLAAFIKGLEDSDPDPVAACEELELCQYVAGGEVKMHSYTAAPDTVALGGEVVLMAEFTVVNETSTGEIRFSITPKGGSGVNADNVAMPTPPGNYRAECKVPTGANKQGQGVILEPGTVDSAFFLCEGQCGDTKWKHSHTYVKAVTNFTVTKA